MTARHLSYPPRQRRHQPPRQTSQPRRVTARLSLPGRPQRRHNHTDGGTGFNDIHNSDQDTTTYTIADLANGTTYTLAVRAVNATGDGTASIVSATPASTPAAPTNLSATPGDGQVELTWDDPSDDTITKYQYSTDGGTGFNDIHNSDQDTTDYCRPGQRHHLHVGGARRQRYR